MRDKLSQSEAGKLGAIASKETNKKLYLQRIEIWNKNPKLCKFCKVSILYDKRRNDFCNHVCAANYTSQSKGFTLLNNKLYTCLFCNVKFKAKGYEGAKYCSRQCMMDFWWQENKNELLNNGYDTSYGHKIAKKYLIELYEGKCQMCGNNEWLSKPIALVIDHISGNSDDGSLTNLRVICNNCDATTDTYKAKNIGNGRAKRRQRYAEGKSY